MNSVASTTAANNGLQRQISYLNQKGAIALASGNDKEAYRNFRSVVEGLRALSDSTGQTAAAGDGDLHSVMLTSLSVPNMQDERFYVFGQVLAFQFNDQQFSQPSLPDICLCSCIALFNMALTYHRKAMIMGNRQLFVTTARVYEQALTVANGLLEGYSFVHCLKVLIRNNLAHVYYFELDAFDESLEHLELIHPSLDGFRQPSAGVVDNDAKEEIMLNLLLTKPPATAGCA